jgi:hypothetical protein
VREKWGTRFDCEAALRSDGQATVPARARSTSAVAFFT